MYLPTENVSLDNFTMLDASQFSYQDLDTDNITDALWCQSDANLADNIGTWYRPPGTNNQVPNTMYNSIMDAVHYAGQVGLYREQVDPFRDHDHSKDIVVNNRMLHVSVRIIASSE